MRRLTLAGIVVTTIGIFLFLFPLEVRVSQDHIVYTGPFFLPAIVPISVGVLMILWSRDRIREAISSKGT